MKKNPVLFTLTTLALAGAAQAAVDKAHCYTNRSYGAGITVSYNDSLSKCIATIDADGDDHNTALNLPKDTTVTVDSVNYFRRNAVKSKPQTFVPPFTTSGCSITGYGKLGKLSRIKYSNSKWSIEVAKETSFTAKTPYVFELNNTTSDKIGTISIGGSGCTITFDASSQASQYQLDATSGDTQGIAGTWTIIGTYTQKIFTPSEVSNGHIYGFASKAIETATGESTYLGQFVKAGCNDSTCASVPPLRAYLVFNKAAAKASVDASMLLDVDEEDLPSTIEVVFEDEEGTQSIGTLNTRTGEIAMDKDLWFDMKGRKFNKEPTVKGTYYNQGKKVVIK